MKVWRQTKLYKCFLCKCSYLHDDAHAHVQHQCPARPAARLKAWLANNT